MEEPTSENLDADTTVEETTFENPDDSLTTPEGD